MRASRDHRIRNGESLVGSTDLAMTVYDSSGQAKVTVLQVHVRIGSANGKRKLGATSLYYQRIKDGQNQGDAVSVPLMSKGLRRLDIKEGDFPLYSLDTGLEGVGLKIWLDGESIRNEHHWLRAVLRVD